MAAIQICKQQQVQPLPTSSITQAPTLGTSAPVTMQRENKLSLQLRATVPNESIVPQISKTLLFPTKSVMNIDQEISPLNQARQLSRIKNSKGKNSLSFYAKKSNEDSVSKISSIKRVKRWTWYPKPTSLHNTTNAALGTLNAKLA